MVYRSSDQHELDEWAESLSMSVIIGFVFVFFSAGKVLHYYLSKKGVICGLLIPPTILSGFIGLSWFSLAEHIDNGLTADLAKGLEYIKVNLISFVFSALILGLHTTSKSSQVNQSIRGVVLSIIHEGLPMVVYSQIIIWGHSFCCLMLLILLNMFGGGVHPLFAAMVPVGLEQGQDILVAENTESASAKTKYFWSDTLVTESESLGLMTSCVIAVLFITYKPLLVSKGWLESSKREVQKEKVLMRQSSGDNEVFSRNIKGGREGPDSPTRRGREGEMRSRYTTHDDVDDDNTLNGALNNMHDKDNDGSVAVVSGSNNDDQQAGLPGHLSLISLCVFLAFGLSFSVHIVEIQFAGHFATLLGIRMFKLAMILSLIAMLFVTRNTNVKFRRDTFMLLSGLFLDIVFIASLSKAYPRPHAHETTHYLLISLFVVVCILWNLLCAVFIAKQIFPNFAYERALVLSCGSVGNAVCGLLIARVIDPTLISPVPQAYSCKFFLFFIPDSTMKNKIMIKIVTEYGSWVALVIVTMVLFGWLYLFHSYFRVHHSMINMDDKEETTSLLGNTDHDLSSDNNGGNNKVRRTLSSPNSRVGSAVDLHDLERQREGEVLHHITCSEPSTIANANQLSTIASWLPQTQRIKTKWSLRYSLSRDGANLDTMLWACRPPKAANGRPVPVQYVILIEDSHSYIFGAYVGHAIEPHSKYYGSGENFVFRLYPHLDVYKWTGNNNYFLLTDRHSFAAGGGNSSNTNNSDGGFAFQLDDELDTGCSYRSATYENAQLSSHEFFKCLNLEVWQLEDF